MAEIQLTPVERARQIPSLDGLRALSVVLVLVLHTLLKRTMAHVPWYLLALGNGALGVQIFFVLSGYLITTLLLRERAKTGRISLKSFFLRRCFRILPPLYVYVFFLLLLGALGHLPGMHARQLVAALTFTLNYLPHAGLWAMEHLWSICVEEQFYLIWPVVLVACVLHRSDTAGRKLASRVAIAVIVAEPFLRVLPLRSLRWFQGPGTFQMNADGLMFGALGALQQGRERFERIYALSTRWPWLLPVVLFGGSGVLAVMYGNYWSLPIGMTVNGFVILMWMLWLARHPASRQGRGFNQPAVVWVGRLSYSLYLWQTFYLHPLQYEVWGRLARWNTFPMNWVWIFMTAAVSYYCVEQPSLRLRDRALRRMGWREI